jgi:hypothetical protein
MGRKIRRPKATPRLMAIVQERRAAQAVEEALAQDRISEVTGLPAKRPRPKDAEAQGNRRHA